MKRLLRRALFGFAVVIILSGQTLRAEDRAEAPLPFRVGVIAPLTGGLAEYGLAAQNGIKFAVAQHPELFTSVEFFYEDSQWDAKSSVAAFNRLRSASGVSLIYNWGNPTSEAIAPLAEQYRMPMIGMTLDPIAARGRKFVIRTTNPAADFSKRLAEYLKAKNFKRLGIVMSQNTYVQGLVDGLKSQLGSDQTLDIVSNHEMSESDFRTSVTRVKSGRYDALGVFLITGQVSTFYRQLAQQKVSLPTFGTDFFESTTEIKLSEGGMEGAVYPHLGVTPAFAKEYVERFGNDYQLAYAGNAYDMAVLIGTLFNNVSGPLGADAVIGRLVSSLPLTGVSGTFHYRHTPDGDSYFEFPVELKRIAQGEFAPLPDEPRKVPDTRS